ncbi:unnamed protein product [Allacma fusca]|uniref:G-protein coupled receptors family 2 profile 2 domain-containing protein n=1 Tax=Allacma fusca TaxID=39272 RepID=A0A8J2J5I8_9HEXA|nr:unnamed protein product [Allacma fusca]
MNAQIFEYHTHSIPRPIWFATCLIVSLAIYVNGANAAEEDPITFQWCNTNHGIKYLKQVAPAKFVIPENLSEDRIKFEIRLNLANFSCPNGANAIELMLDLNRPLDDPEKHESDFSSSGFFRHGTYYFPPEVFCIASWTASKIAVRVCSEFKNENQLSFPECDTSNHCIPKCCPMDMLLTSSAEDIPKCHPKFNSSARVTPTLYAKDLQKSSSRKPMYFYTQSFFSQDENEAAVTMPHVYLKKFIYFSKHCFRIMEDGALQHLENYKWIQVPRANYCLDGIQFQGKSSKNFEGRDDQYLFLLNYSSKIQRRNEAELAPAWISSLVASVFYLLTFLVLLLQWEEQKLPGWLALSQFGTLTLSHVVFSLNILISDWILTRGFLCVASGATVYFLYLSGYCWLTAICFNLFYTFRKLTNANADEDSVVSYIRYAIFGWGAPLLLATISIILDQIYSYDPCNQVLVPQYGVESCFISAAASGLYVVFPVLLLVIVNTILFSITSYKLCAYSKSNSITRESFARGKKFFKLIAKLILVMGLTWIINLILVILWNHGEGQMDWYWKALAVFIFIQSFVIFMVYSCKSSTFASLKKHYPILTPLLSTPENIKSYQ